MPDSDPQIYLATPAHFELSAFADTLRNMLDTFSIACVRLSLATTDEEDWIRAADHLREICSARDVALVVDQHFRLVERLGLDGVHLTDGTRNIREARKLLGNDRIVGTFCGNSRHQGMNAAEIGADYVSFGPVSQSALGDGQTAPVDLFSWWSEMIEVPVVAEGGLTSAHIPILRNYTDFFCLGDELWSHEAGPVEALSEFLALISGET